MILYRKARPLEIVDSTAIWPLFYVKPIEITEDDIFKIIQYHTPERIYPHDRRAAKAIMTKLKGE